MTRMNINVLEISSLKWTGMGEFNSDDLFITGSWNEKVGSQEIPGVTGKLGFRVQNEAGQRLT